MDKNINNDNKLTTTKKVFLSTIFLLLSVFAFSQNYSYRDYLSDHQLLGKLNRQIRNRNIDSVKLILNSYKNRLGFTYFQCKALIANHDSDSNQLRYLDSAFMQGMTPLCIDLYLQKFDSVKVYESFKRNYLRSYNVRLINLVDSIHYRDQHYRQQIEIEHKIARDEANNPSKKNADGNKQIVIKKQSNQEILDSLWKMQSLTDSTNFIKLNQIIDQYGWPSAKLVGDYYCQRPGPDVTMLIIHLGNTKREYQIATLKKVIELCKKQEDSWQNAESLMYLGLHGKFSREFSEFSFLDIKNNHLIMDESFFSIYNMSKMLIGSAAKIEIKCAKVSLFNELRQAMLSINDLIKVDEMALKRRKEFGLPPPQIFDESTFVFIESPEIKDNVIQYKISKK